MVQVNKHICFNSNAILMHILTADNCRNNLCGSIKNQQNEESIFSNTLTR